MCKGSFKSSRFKGVSRKIKWCSKGVFSGFQGCLKEVQREFQRGFKGVSLFHGSVKGVPRIFLGCFMEISRIFQESFKGVSRKI